MSDIAPGLPDGSACDLVRAAGNAVIAGMSTHLVIGRLLKREVRAAHSIRTWTSGGMLQDGAHGGTDRTADVEGRRDTRI